MENLSRAGIIFTIFLIILVFSAGSCHSRDGQFRNVILFIADGMGSAHTTLSRWCKGAPLRMDEMNVGAMRTYSADSVIADSAPAATAFASGYKTSNRFIGIMPDKPTIPGIPDLKPLRFQPVASVLEGARLTGRSTGLVATSNIQHATPASFSAHWPDRSDYKEIAKQQLYQDITVILGGGRKYLTPGQTREKKGNGNSLIESIRMKGYTIVSTRDEMMKPRPDKLWGMFSDLSLAYDIDRLIVAPEEPALSEMTNKAIEVLDNNTGGFFLLVEGSKIDWASHAHDPVGVVSDVLAFDEAVGVALDFARKKNDTLVLVVADHGCGGMTLGNLTSGGQLQYDKLTAPIIKARLTGEGIERLMKDDRSNSRIRQIVHTYLGIDHPTSKEMKEIEKAPPGEMLRVIGNLVNNRSYIGWTTSGHTGEDLFFYYYGIDRPFHILENTDIAKIIAKGMNFDLIDVNARLFVEAGEAFAGKGAKISFDRTDAGNPKLIIKKPGRKAEISLSTNIMRITGKSEVTRVLEGIAVFSPKTGKAYIPRQAVTFFEQAE